MGEEVQSDEEGGAKDRGAAQFIGPRVLTQDHHPSHAQ